MRSLCFLFLLAALSFFAAAPALAQNPSTLPEIVEEDEGENEGSTADSETPSESEATIDSDLAPPDIPEARVEGLVYTNPFYGFSIEAPNSDWQFLVDRETVDSFNEEALLVMNAPDLDLYAMAIVEEAPDLSIEDYADRVQPALENLELKSNEPIVLAGDLPAWRQAWEGSFDDIGMRFHYTLVAKEMFRIQIVSWCAKSIWDDEAENQFHSIGLSFRDLGPAMVEKEPAWKPPLFVEETDRYENPRHGFTLARPSEDWTFITERSDLNGINPSATLVLHRDEEVYSMIIVERLPDLSLAEYSGRVVPNLEGGTLVEEEEATLNGLEARRRRWRGKFDDTLFDFFYTMVDLEGKKIQIVSWSRTSMLDENVRAQIRYIEESFAPLAVGIGEN